MPSNEHRPTKRVLDILELLSSNPDGMTLTELAAALDAPKSSIMPLLHTMNARKFIHMQKDSSRYFIGIASYSVGVSYAKHSNVLQFIQSEMKQIVAASNEICQLGIPNRNQILYIAKEDSTEPIRLISHVGKQLPLYCCALGRAILAEKSREEVLALYPDGLTAFTEYTITSWNDLFSELEKTRKRGYAIEREETTLMICCIGVPLYDKGHIAASMSVSVPTFRFSEEKQKEIVELLTESRQRIEIYFQGHEIDFGTVI